MTTKSCPADEFRRMAISFGQAMARRRVVVFPFRIYCLVTFTCFVTFIVAFDRRRQPQRFAGPAGSDVAYDTHVDRPGPTVTRPIGLGPTVPGPTVPGPTGVPRTVLGLTASRPETAQRAKRYIIGGPRRHNRSSTRSRQWSIIFTFCQLLPCIEWSPSEEDFD